MAKSVLATKLQQVRERIEAACASAKRDPAEVTLVAVTKAAAPEQIRELLSLGVADLGESRVQQLVQRASQLAEYHQRRLQYADAPVPSKIRWHMIGHLQRNKVKAVLPHVAMVHSVDSLRLAEEIEAQSARLDRRTPILLQINASEEPQKSGVAVGAAVHLAEQIHTMKHLQLVGLMTMAALDASADVARRTFTRVREIFEELRWHKIGGAALRHLSMGMSNDFEPAILEGATLVRIGTALFGGKPEQSHVDDED